MVQIVRFIFTSFCANVWVALITFAVDWTLKTKLYYLSTWSRTLTPGHIKTRMAGGFVFQITRTSYSFVSWMRCIEMGFVLYSDFKKVRKDETMWVCVCLCLASESSETVEDSIIKLGKVTASDIRLHHVLIILTFKSFIQGRTYFNREHNNCSIVSETF